MRRMQSKLSSGNDPMDAIHQAGIAPRNVVILAFEDTTLSDICGPADVFELANGHSSPAVSRPYRVFVASVNGGGVRTSAGIGIDTLRLADIDFETVDTLIVPGGGPPPAPPRAPPGP